MYKVMDMESGMLENESGEAQAYSAEVLCANWTPVVPMLAEHSHYETDSALPLDLASADVDAFLGRMSVC